MKTKVKFMDYIDVLLMEANAFIKNKYDIKTINFFYDKKTHWEIHKPIFYFDVYPKSQVDDTAWVMELFYFKIRRKN